MTSPVRRSTRIKRRLAAEPNDKTAKKRPRNANLPHKPKTLSDQPKPTYRQDDQTIFLADDFKTIHWLPPPHENAKPLRPATYLRSFKYDHHNYFASPQAGQHASQVKMLMYRNIGSIRLDGFSQSRRRDSILYFRSLRTSNEQLINLSGCLRGAKMDDTDLQATLVSLTDPNESLWPSPYIVLAAKRDDIVRASSAGENGPGITAHVFIGRLLFELVACHDIKILFEALKPSHPYTPLPKLPEYEKVFSRSPSNGKSSHVSANNILREAESLGYQNLTESQKRKIGRIIHADLYPFQEQTIRWMLDMENGPHALNDFFWEERYFAGPDGTRGGPFYYFPYTGDLRLRKPPGIRGGMVAEEMGLGKTIEALALIAAQQTRRESKTLDVWCEKDPKDITVKDGFVAVTRLRERNEDRGAEPLLFHHGDEVLNDAPDDDFPKYVQIRRWPPQTTLVVCPRTLIGQWEREARRRAPSLSVQVWTPGQHVSECAEPVFAIGKDAKDIVIVGYEALRNNNLLSKICWRRVILDETQLTRRSTTLVASDVYNLRTPVRFLMTGTPIVNNLNDLKGELAMLKVWPFTLDEDGFWEHHIQTPFKKRRRIPLLTYLLRVTMMRHTKGQNLKISLPPRTYQTIEIDLVGSHRACYCYILGSCLEELEAQGQGHIDTRRLRILMRLMVVICLSPFTIDLFLLDLARRFTWSRRRAASYLTWQSDKDVPPLRQVSATEAIQFVAESATRIVRDNTRSFATSHANISNELDRFLRMPLEKLREQAVAKNVVSEAKALRLQRERLAALSAGGVHRLATDTLQELRDTAVDVGIVSRTDVRAWSRAVAMAKLQVHYDLLNGIERTRTVHESGFAAITKIMEGNGNPNCPVCLTDCNDRVAVTKCGHLYCVDCCVLMFESGGGIVRCAICRRELLTGTVVEIIRSPPEKSGAKEESANVTNSKTESAPLEGSGKAAAIPANENSSRSSSDKRTMTSQSGNGTKDKTEPTHEALKPTARDAWAEYDQLGQAPSRFRFLGRDPGYPSLDAPFLQHLAAIKGGLESPKLSVLKSLIASSPATAKFCVVAGSMQSLRVIHEYLGEQNIVAVGAGTPCKPNHQRSSITNASVEFSENRDVRVFLLNPSHAMGLTLIAAEYVIFMEPLLRLADEVQAAARVHRIGQMRPVKIIRLVARNTVEELIVRRRGEIKSPEEESEFLTSLNYRDASDKLILDLLRDDPSANA